MGNAVYTHDEAYRIVEYFEEVLLQNGIVIPSPEDDERGEDNTVALYGSVYSDLLDSVEEALIKITTMVKDGSPVIPYEFSVGF